MKWVKINFYQKGFVYRNGKYKRMLRPGKHCLGLGESAYIIQDTILLGYVKDIALIDQLRQIFDALL